ncbi:MAG: HlyD family type I secretion periplasmic adaptor subunit [Betaproteobacteria bacterium]|nr:HlyD family type I secretion periplasmic adaptor subunit [Betaproteobacteria bacterium]
MAELRARAKALLDRILFPPAAADPEQRAEAEFMPGRIAVLLQNPPRPAFLIIRGTVALLVVGFLWAAFSTLEEITIGEGKVIPSNQVQVIQNLEGGIVARIPVRVGDIVQKDQIVLNIDQTRFSSSLGETRAKYLALSAKTARLAAEVEGKPFAPPPELQKEDPRLLREEQALYAARQAEQDATMSVLRRQVDQRAQELSEKRAKAAQLAESYKFVQKEVELTRPMAAQKVLSDVELLRLERQASDIKGELDATRLAIPRLESALQEARNKVEGAQAKFRSDAALELSQARAELEGTSASNVAMIDRLERTTVRSPVNGIVKQIKVTTVGGVIQPGSEVMEIVPIEDNLLVEAKVRPADVAFLRPGQKAMVKVTAYDYSIYGGLDATLETITADSITNDKGESFYLVRVRTATNRFGSSNKPLPIIPGMLTTVHIQTGEKSVLSYFMKPIMKARSEALRER